jgi:hypothetical protein
MLVIAAGVVVEKKWAAPGTNPAAAALAGIPNSHTAAMLEQARQVYIIEASDSKPNMVNAPAVAQIQVSDPTPPASSGNAPTLNLPAPDPGSAQSIAQGLMPSYGFSVSTYFSCLQSLWEVESGWNYLAENASGAYGIPQALPGDKMASVASDWATDPTTQIKWGLGYIQSTYGNPCTAWDHEEADGWY